MWAAGFQELSRSAGDMAGERLGEMVMVMGMQKRQTAGWRAGRMAARVLLCVHSWRRGAAPRMYVLRMQPRPGALLSRAQKRPPRRIGVTGECGPQQSPGAVQWDRRAELPKHLLEAVLSPFERRVRPLSIALSLYEAVCTYIHSTTIPGIPTLEPRPHIAVPLPVHIA